MDEELPIYTESTLINYIQGSGGAIGFTISRSGENEETYYYQRNLLGDVTHIYGADGILKARYIYDAWGNHKVLDHNGIENNNKEFIGNVNPIRYRGYYFDCETRLYYLQTRYYDPSTGRFVNADSIDYADPESINGLNLYVYCNSNPIMRHDPSGHLSLPFSLNPLDYISAGISSVTNTLGNVANTIGGLYGGFVDFIQSDMGLKILIGSLIIIGLIALTVASGGTAIPLLMVVNKIAMGAFIGAFSSAFTGAFFGGMTDVGWSWDGAADGFLAGAITGAIAGGASVGLGNAASGLISMGKIGAKGNVLLGIGGNAGIGGSISAAQGIVTGSFSPIDVAIATAFGGVGGKIGLKYPNLHRGKEALIGFGLGFTEGGVGIAIEKRFGFFNKIGEIKAAMDAFNRARRYIPL